MTNASAATAMIPHHVYDGFLGAGRNRELLEYALRRRGEFEPSTLVGGQVDASRRISERLLDLGPTRHWFEATIRNEAADLFARSGVPPFDIEYVELEIAAHGNGAHFAVHTDIPLGWGRAPAGGDRTGTQDRLLSAVYYFHRVPAAFSGGELRLHRFGSNGAVGDFVDIEPANDRLVVFPSWVSHEVLRVACPNANFQDYRFAINCWLCRKLPVARPLPR